LVEPLSACRAGSRSCGWRSVYCAPPGEPEKVSQTMGEAECQHSLASLLPRNTEPGRRTALGICPMSGGIESEREKVARRRDDRGEECCGRARIAKKRSGRYAAKGRYMVKLIQPMKWTGLTAEPITLLCTPPFTCRSTDPDTLLSAIVLQ
jgi:hypothetical protein